MHYEVWGLHPANLIAAVDSREQAVSLVRELLEAGWNIEELSVSQEPDEGDADEQASLPVWEGASLQNLVHTAA